jgi:hypothetical protein
VCRWPAPTGIPVKSDERFLVLFLQKRTACVRKERQRFFLQKEAKTLFIIRGFAA